MNSGLPFENNINTWTNGLLDGWMALSQLQSEVAAKLEQELKARHNWSLNDFYLLYFLSVAPEKKLRLQQLEAMLGLSQSAVSRLVSRFEARGCGALRRHICEEDRRSIYTGLTELGEGKVQEALATFLAVLGETLSAETLMQAVALLKPNGQLNEGGKSNDL
ncbi:MarR family winged helix-turn-helix transcriptional regulator [Paenibacillus sp. YN15]|uniref:MarR family winged helix-turn-helix transcriptional regulator n=1 Tax=Paenibacillus sp. YN15 TaxID=1742774 RepID=UPI000DCE5897|nr:MarR family transcriptional regulator [Paenibacillus sp. YN15]RAV05056.1 MarR family transcriptional regulator [Paenibacillus sp. YN15]